MSNDRYEKIRKALEIGPTPGPWLVCPTNSDNCGCDWLDNGLNPVGCPYCKLSAEAEASRRTPTKEVDFFTPGARLALELECLLLDTRNDAVQSRWWDSAHEALEQWRQAVRAMDLLAETLEDVRKTKHEQKGVVAWARLVYARPVNAPKSAEEWDEMVDVEFHTRPEKPEGEGWYPLVVGDRDLTARVESDTALPRVRKEPPEIGFLKYDTTKSP